MSEPFVGEIRMFGFNFAPRGWAFCHGSLLPIAQYNALFSLLGTNFGGDGRTSFGLPDLRGRCPIGEGTGPGLSTRRLGEKSGAESHTLTVNQMPSHTHNLASSDEGTETIPVNKYLAVSDDRNYVSTGGSPVGGAVGGGQPVKQMPPYLGINFCIALALSLIHI